MIGGFDVIPKFKRIFHPSEYNPRLAVVILGPTMLLVYAFLLPRIIRRKFSKRKGHPTKIVRHKKKK